MAWRANGDQPPPGVDRRAAAAPRRTRRTIFNRSHPVSSRTAQLLRLAGRGGGRAARAARLICGSDTAFSKGSRRLLSRGLAVHHPVQCPVQRDEMVNGQVLGTGVRPDAALGEGGLHLAAWRAELWLELSSRGLCTKVRCRTS